MYLIKTQCEIGSQSKVTDRVLSSAKTSAEAIVVILALCESEDASTIGTKSKLTNMALNKDSDMVTPTALREPMALCTALDQYLAMFSLMVKALAGASGKVVSVVEI